MALVGLRLGPQFAKAQAVLWVNSVSQVEEEPETQEVDKDLETFADAATEAQDFTWDSILDEDEDDIVVAVD